MLTKRDVAIGLSDPVTAAIIAVVSALIAVILLAWCVVTRRHFRRTKRRPAALQISSPFDFMQFEKSPIFADKFGNMDPNRNPSPRSPSTRLSQPSFPVTPMGTHGDAGSASPSDSTSVGMSGATLALGLKSFESKYAPLDAQSLTSETASIYSAASAPRVDRGQYYTQSFTIEGNSNGRQLAGRWPNMPALRPSAFTAILPSRLKPTRPSSRPSSLATDDDASDNLTQLLSRVHIARRQRSFISPSSASSPSDVPVVPRSAQIRSTSIPIPLTSNTAGATVNFHARQLSVQTTAPLNIRPREWGRMSVGASVSSVPSHTRADEQPQRPHDRRPLRPPSHVVWKTVEKIESVM